MAQGEDRGLQQPHKLSLDERKKLTVSGVGEVVSFEENAVVLRTSRGTLLVRGQDLHLKTLSLDGGQVAVDGTVQCHERKPGRTLGFSAGAAAPCRFALAPGGAKSVWTACFGSTPEICH